MDDATIDKVFSKDDEELGEGELVPLKKGEVPHKMPPKPRLLGRDPLFIDEDLVYRLAKIDCTNKEMAAIIGCCVSTLTKRFSHIIEKGKMSGNKSLRRKMWNMAVRGSPSMLIFLAKNRLGYRDLQNAFPTLSRREK